MGEGAPGWLKAVTTCGQPDQMNTLPDRARPNTRKEERGTTMVTGTKTPFFPRFLRAPHNLHSNPEPFHSPPPPSNPILYLGTPCAPVKPHKM